MVVSFLPLLLAAVLLGDDELAALIENGGEIDDRAGPIVEVGDPVPDDVSVVLDNHAIGVDVTDHRHQLNFTLTVGLTGPLASLDGRAGVGETLFVQSEEGLESLLEIPSALGPGGQELICLQLLLVEVAVLASLLDDLLEVVVHAIQLDGVSLDAVHRG